MGLLGLGLGLRLRLKALGRGGGGRRMEARLGRASKQSHPSVSILQKSTTATSTRLAYWLAQA
ncbi:uncharacterized protein PG986_007242 [Apiospora aurea]|uniref:Uncharacterized protein n=1 Tax=Apiospora aurea TaxID=335848 RepID=A0ABR1QC08_9PEZI